MTCPCWSWEQTTQIKTRRCPSNDIGHCASRGGFVWSSCSCRFFMTTHRKILNILVYGGAVINSASRSDLWLLRTEMELFIKAGSLWHPRSTALSVGAVSLPFHSLTTKDVLCSESMHLGLLKPCPQMAFLLWIITKRLQRATYE